MKYLKPTIAGLIAWSGINAMGTAVFFAGGMEWGTAPAGMWVFLCLLFSSAGAALAFGLTGDKK